MEPIQSITVMNHHTLDSSLQKEFMNKKLVLFESENFETLGGHKNCIFELSGPTTVFSGYSPIVSPDEVIFLPFIDNWFLNMRNN